MYDILLITDAQIKLDPFRGHYTNAPQLRGTQCDSIALMSQLMKPSLFSGGSLLKAHLTFSSPSLGAGNKTEECTCLLGWPTSSSLLLNYSRALKCSSVWQHATRAPLFAPHDSSLTELPFMHEKVQVCACECARCQTLMAIHACVMYTHKTPPRFDIEDFFELWTEKDLVREKQTTQTKTQDYTSHQQLCVWMHSVN